MTEPVIGISRSQPPSLVEIHVSVPDGESAQMIADALVARQEAACVQILGPMTSIYTWKGEVHRAQEWLMLIKTTEDAFDRVAHLVTREHRYEVPEIIAVPVTDALGVYADWVRKNSDGIDDQELLDS